ncbi:NAD-dependent epimerase/dehydratase family protein [Paenibacillus rhizoplanae]
MSGRRRLLITGASGFTGRHAVAYFAAGGAEVTAVVRRKPEAELFPDGVQQYVCDLGGPQGCDGNDWSSEAGPGVAPGRQEFGP